MSDIDWNDPDAVVGKARPYKQDVCVRDLDPSIVKQMRAARKLANATHRFLDHDYRCECPYNEAGCTSVGLSKGLAAWKEATSDGR